MRFSVSNIPAVFALVGVLLVRELQTVLAASVEGDDAKAACWDAIVVNRDFGNVDCLVNLLVQVLNLVVVAGAFTYKLPQIIKIARAGDVAGISPMSLYFETLSFMTTTVYHIRSGNPIGAWAENVVILVQQAVLVIQIWLYAKSSLGHIALVIGTAAAIMAVEAFGVPGDSIPLLFTITIPMASASRIPQIWANFRNGHTGQLAFITLGMGFGGSAARVLTSLKQVDDVVVAYGFAIACMWNLILVVQVLAYWSTTNKVLAERAEKKKAAVAASKPSSSAEDKKKN